MKRNMLSFLLKEERAQATLEYAITVMAVLSIVVACAAVWRAGSEGVFARLIQDALSHTFSPTGAIDISLY